MVDLEFFALIFLFVQHWNGVQKKFRDTNKNPEFNLRKQCFHYITIIAIQHCFWAHLVFNIKRKTIDSLELLHPKRPHLAGRLQILRNQDNFQFYFFIATLCFIKLYTKIMAVVILTCSIVFSLYLLYKFYIS